MPFPPPTAASMTVCRPNLFWRWLSFLPFARPASASTLRLSATAPWLGWKRRMGEVPLRATKCCTENMSICPSILEHELSQKRPNRATRQPTRLTVTKLKTAEASSWQEHQKHLVIDLLWGQQCEAVGPRLQGDLKRVNIFLLPRHPPRASLMVKFDSTYNLGVNAVMQ